MEEPRGSASVIIPSLHISSEHYQSLSAFSFSVTHKLFCFFCSAMLPVPSVFLLLSLIHFLSSLCLPPHSPSLPPSSLCLPQINYTLIYAQLSSQGTLLLLINHPTLGLNNGAAPLAARCRPHGWSSSLRGCLLQYICLGRFHSHVPLQTLYTVLDCSVTKSSRVR